MASAAQSLRLALRSSRRAAPPFQLCRPQPFMVLRPLSMTAPCRRKKAKDDAAEEIDEEDDRIFADQGEAIAEIMRQEDLSEADRAQATQAMKIWEELPLEKKKQLQQEVQEVRTEFRPLAKTTAPIRDSWWNDEEMDPEMVTNEWGEEDFEEDDITSMGHAKLEEHREHREYARITVWDMPLLSKLAKPFEPPSNEHVLRFRYTSYMGEFHPAEKKVVVQFCPSDLGLTEQQQMKMAKLVGSRYNPETKIIKMSCEMFEHQAQNKRYLGDLVEKLIVQAKDPADTFEDIPLDTRHHVVKTKPKFPKEWRMTPQRKQELEAIRQQALIEDERKRREGTLIDGKEIIAKALSPRPEVDGRVAQLLSAGPRTTITRPLRASGPIR